MRLLALMIVAAAALPWAASAQVSGSVTRGADGTDASYTATVRPGQDPNERVCRSITYTGSRLGGERVCKSRREWSELAERARERTDEVVNGGLRNSCIGGPGGVSC